MKHKILGYILWGFFLIGIIYLLFFNIKNNLNGYHFSELSYEKWEGTTKAYNIKGSIKNVSNKTCDGKLLNVEIELKSGSIKDISYIYISNPKRNEIKNFDETIFTDLTNFKLKVKKVNCFLDEDTK